MIDKAKITNPHMWQLVIEISGSHLSAMVFCPTQDNSLQRVEVALQRPGTTARQSLEEAVYDNPGLTDDYGKVTVLWRSERFAVIPGFVTDNDLAEAILRRQFVEEKSEGDTEVLTDTLEGVDARIIYEVPAELLNFVRRTFNNPRVMHPLTPLTLWFAAKCHGRRGGKTLACLGNGTLDLVILGQNTPLLINSFDTVEATDAVYYTLAARRAFSLADTDEVMLAGPAAERAAVTPLLRRYVNYVMPAIFPADMFSLGHGIMACPFEMAVAPSVL